jgi:hypothetical protein
VTAPAQCAGQTAEAARALVHATLAGGGGLMVPADAYDVTGSPAILAARLRQALAQLSAFLEDQVNAGRVIIVAGEHTGDPATAISLARHHLETASAAAQRLQQALDAARNTLTWAGANTRR